MVLEVGFKITKTRDDITSITEFQLSKDQAGPLFVSRETDTMFFLTGYLKDYSKENVEIQINEDGTRICISGRKPVEEMVLRRWVMLTKEVEIRGFRKVFKIPPCVVLDRIKAKYKEVDSILTIFMPKKERGIRGISIEEVEEEGAPNVRLEEEQKAAEEIPQKSQADQKEKEIFEDKSQEMHVETSEIKDLMGEIAEEDAMGTESVEKLPTVQEGNGKAAALMEEEAKTVAEELPEKIETVEAPPEDSAPQSSKEKKRRSKRLCPPLVISGSTLLLTLIAIVIHFIRSKKR